MLRPIPLATGEYYHIFSKSIAKYKVFKNRHDFARMVHLMRYYQFIGLPLSYSIFLRSPKVKKHGVEQCLQQISRNQERLVHILAYCLMPTHVHFVLKQIVDDGISQFIGNVLNGYSRYFNIKNKRLGPLWTGRFKNVLVESDQQLLHLTRYVHLNPYVAQLVSKPEEWVYSSYREYINQSDRGMNICCYRDVIDLSCKRYKKFVEGGSYQTPGV